MPKNKISEFDVNPDNNTDINSINIAEGCAPSGINNAIRQLMSDLKEFQTGAGGDAFTVGGALVASGTFSANGGATLGDASGDALTINSSAVSIPNGLNFGSNNLVLSGGNVGIGTSSPDSPLQVIGQAKFGVSSNPVRINSSVGTGIIEFSCETNIIRTIGATALVFQTNSAERMRIDSSGNVGIGTSANLTAKINFDATDRGETINIYSSASEASRSGIGKYPSETRFYVGTSDFYTWRVAGPGGTERMRLTNNGRLQLGSSSNAGSTLWIKRDVQGDWSDRNITLEDNNGSASQPAIGFHAAGNATAGIFKFWGGGANFECRNSNDSGFIAISASAFNVSSDYRIKTEIEQAGTILPSVLSLRPVSYLKDGVKGREYGLIAHEVAEQLPELVSGEKDAMRDEGSMELQTVNYMALSVVLVKAIQEQQAIITDLKARIETLESK